MQKLRLITRFLSWLWAAKTKYQVHSPFVYDFATEILEDKRQYYAFSYLEKLRSHFLKDKNSIQVKDYGAGSYSLTNKQRRISDIAKASLTSPFYCRILFKIVNQYQPKTILELGTSLGLTTLYLAHANPKASVFTFEGCPNLSQLARDNFERMKTGNIELITGEFGETLPLFLQNTDSLDLAFIDGNHRKAPTLQYFEWCLAKSNENTIFVFDDIYWSDEMVQAWKEIKRHPATRLSIDLFYMGVVFLRKEQKTPEHFKLSPTAWKPWVMGFFK